MAKVTLPDGSILDVAEGISVKKIAEQIGPRLAEDALAAKVNGQLSDLSTLINGDVELQILTAKDPEGLEVIRHSCLGASFYEILLYTPNLVKNQLGVIGYFPVVIVLVLVVVLDSISNSAPRSYVSRLRERGGGRGRIVSTSNNEHAGAA